MSALVIYDVQNIELSDKLVIEPIPGATLAKRIEIAPVESDAAVGASSWEADAEMAVRMAQDGQPLLVVTDDPATAEAVLAIGRHLKVPLHQFRLLRSPASRITGVAAVTIAFGDPGANAAAEICERLEHELRDLTLLLCFAQGRGVLLSGFKLVDEGTVFGYRDDRDPRLLGKPWAHCLVLPQHLQPFLLHSLKALEEMTPENASGLGTAIRLHQIGLREDAPIEIRYLQHYNAVELAAPLLGAPETQKTGAGERLQGISEALSDAGWPNEALISNTDVDEVVQFRHDIVHQGERASEDRIHSVRFDNADAWREQLMKRLFDLRRLFEILAFHLMGFSAGTDIHVTLSRWDPGGYAEVVPLLSTGGDKEP